MMQQLFRIYSLRIFGEKVSRVFERGYIFFFRKSLDLKKERRERERKKNGRDTCVSLGCAI